MLDIILTRKDLRVEYTEDIDNVSVYDFHINQHIINQAKTIVYVDGFRSKVFKNRQT